MSKGAFERYAPFIREYIYRKQWTDLREVQVDACNTILDTDHHVIIASGTASGKTEAAFFPMLTLLEQAPAKSIGILYIGPLKALINDQFNRLSELLEDRQIPVWPWHGDVAQSIKLRALRQAQGILQITPESLEALLMKRPGDAMRLFSDLRFVVIDEIHALMGTDRGLQVLCLLTRLEKMAACFPRRIALSATLNDYEPAMRFLCLGTARDAVAIGVRAHKRTISLCAESFILPEDPKAAETTIAAYHAFIYDQCHDQKCLLFTNSRSDAEDIITNMKEIAQSRLERDVFYVHHGSISALLRQEAEAALRESTGPVVTAATLTLELGIDIGDLDSTIQLGAPFSCASFVQRLGRSGRRSGKSKMLFVDLYHPDESNPFDVLPWVLLRIIAIIQLYLEERWVEPFDKKPKPYSLLAHQTLSTLMTYGELSPAELAGKVLTLPAFQGMIDLEEYRELLRHMIDTEYLGRMESGGIIVGLKGERITNHYSFYAVFQGDTVYHVYNSADEIGTLDNCPAVDEIFVLAGRAWKVESVDEERKRIYVRSIKGKRIPSWAGFGGSIHIKIVQRMREILQEDTQYEYLQKNALTVIQQARRFAQKASILDRDIIAYGDHSFFLCPWVGTKELQSIKALLLHELKEDLQIRAVSGGLHHLEITSGISMDAIISAMKALTVNQLDPSIVLPPQQAPLIDKYDYMVPATLLRKAFLLNEMHVQDAITALHTLRA